jgi:hypothetical protein
MRERESTRAARGLCLAGNGPVPANSAAVRAL